jgi:hypothetical protein
MEYKVAFELVMRLDYKIKILHIILRTKRMRIS